MGLSDTFAESVRVRGWAVTDPVVPLSVLAELMASLAGDAPGPLRGGVRNLLDLPGVTRLAQSDPVRGVAACVLGPACFAVRGLLFDKQPDANWKVPWHQDLTIAVRARHATDGYGPWSSKAGVTHVQAPPEVLARMVCVRVHLDDCGPDNGPLRLLPGSHESGVLRPPQVETWVAAHAAETGVAGAGAILAFRPLLLHASSAATAPSHRRVVHLDFAAAELPAGLHWHWRV